MTWKFFRFSLAAAACRCRCSCQFFPFSFFFTLLTRHPFFLFCSSRTTHKTQFKTVSPLGDRVFVKVDEAEATSAGGILLPSAAQVKSTQGVVAKGAAKSKALSEGDRVLYSKYAGTEIKMGKDEYVLLKVSGVLLGEEMKQGGMDSVSPRSALRLVFFALKKRKKETLDRHRISPSLDSLRSRLAC